ncbi:MAG: tetratricopeptide repeat protein [Rhodobacteraceae bacterium]|nr:tetratricopeptide repeat protein [Alphaproteobacteria bacterium]MBT8475651.1 tetratricopeptide repeat protein [Alphaproteobacteria bacterium]NNK65555.1 tetratricopeptide repeat protein [Paracoccaceae bacterium]
MRKIIAGMALLATASCSGVGVGEFSAFSDGSASIQDTSNRDYYPNDELIVVGKAQFKEENYGLAYRSFKKAIDVAPEDPQAWLGYAASADMLRRFDKADFAYRKIQPVVGNRIEFLNNFGYSQLLRGNLQSARAYFLRAYEIDPSNETTANNLELLRNSVSYQRRAPGDLRGI